MHRNTVVALLLLSVAIVAPVTDPPSWPAPVAHPSPALVRSDLAVVNNRIDELRAVDEVGFAKNIERLEQDRDRLLELSRE